MRSLVEIHYDIECLQLRSFQSQYWKQQDDTKVTESVKVFFAQAQIITE